MVVRCNCEACKIASCEERSYYPDDWDPDFNEEYEYEKQMDYEFFKRHGNDPDWAR